MPLQEMRYALLFTCKAMPADEMGQQMSVEGEAGDITGLDPLLTGGSAQAIGFSSLVTPEEDGSFDENGTITFPAGELHFSSPKPGAMEPSALDRLQHGMAVWQVDGGTGIFSDATGTIMSNFTVSEEGVVSDAQAAVLFLKNS